MKEFPRSNRNYINPYEVRGNSPHEICKREGMPLRMLPNVKSFTITLKTYDFLFKLFGINRKFKPDIEIEILSGKIKSMNRYLVHQFMRIRKHPKGWDIARILIKRSVAYRLVAFRHIIPN